MCLCDWQAWKVPFKDFIGFKTTEICCKHSSSELPSFKSVLLNKTSNNSSKPPHPKLAATKSVSATPQPSASSKTTRKDPKPPLPDSMAWSRPPPSAIVTKTGLYLTMPDPSTRNPPHIDPPKSRKPYKPRTKVPTPAGPEIPKASSSTTQSSSFSAAPQCDFNSLNYIHSFEAKMFEMGLTSFDQLFSATSTNLNNKAVTDYTAIDALDLDRFFNENTSIGAPLSQPTITPSHSNDFIEIIGQPTDLMGYLNSTMMDITSPFSQTSFSETMVQYPSGTHSYSSSFLPSTSEPSISRQNSYLFADAFGSESMATAASAADLFSGDSLLDTMMTNWDLESLDGSVLSQPVDSLSNGDVNSIFRPQVFSSQHQPLFTQSLVSAWLPNLPDKNFPEVGLSSSLSSVSSLATSCSTMSNASDLLANKPQSRKRQYHSTSSNLPQPAPTDKTSDMALKKGSVPSTSRSSRPPTTTAKVNAPKLHPPPSTPRSTNIPTTLPRTRPLMTASSRPPSASVTKTAFGSSIHSTTSRTPATRPASRLQPQELSVRGEVTEEETR
ncbi:hypothetical protein BCR33DRAFT_92667 [Rhizoclosmatium globosum]|uniref:Uncharacterized protein n=1 Tax=Rhizoclosmatium globosum TaxID=329046 RepID=A0A1Y2CJN7_9FUNG|nr:hypothetical protein BCR33DRAFT_92667 [Rhizoclosmatium globosum]|eukprot:ORY47228.1 hypothetical protein BCR33DRAFT_92667 [Rhizoclosmatium globosum]